MKTCEIDRACVPRRVRSEVAAAALPPQLLLTLALEKRLSLTVFWLMISRAILGDLSVARIQTCVWA
jgi:hypothetical protein